MGTRGAVDTTHAPGALVGRRSAARNGGQRAPAAHPAHTSRATPAPSQRRESTDRHEFTGVPREYAGTHPNGVGAAGPPPGRPFGSILTFGRPIGWSLGEIARVDPG